VADDCAFRILLVARADASDALPGFLAQRIVDAAVVRVGSSAEALAALEDASFDMVVAEDVGGAGARALLAEVQRRAPATLRVLLAGAGPGAPVAEGVVHAVLFRPGRDAG
jgi:hypothetical protein